ncbi:hypothetical protein C8Q76DRAFT_750031 [Earliella scabrosa]|nr:hypothetical protein C8Q76DRAFT_750031 [Earliella scabrosa]
MHDPEVARADSYPHPPTSSVLVHDPGNDADLHIRHPSHPRPPSFTVSDPDKEDAVGVELREVMRTPSPTPTETRVLLQKSRTCDWKALYARIRHPQPYLTTRNISIFVVIFVGTGLTIALLALQKNIVRALLPHADWLRDTPGAWAILLAFLIVLSIPPFFGYEIVATLCGVVYGFWVGFGMVVGGTFIGELVALFVFKWGCSVRSRKLEERRVQYALLAQVLREVGLWVPAVLRYGAIPGPVLTAFFATCGMSMWKIGVAVILTAPRHIAVIFIGMSELQTGTGNSIGTALKVVHILVANVVTFAVMHYIHKQVDEVKHRIVNERRKARKAKALAAATSSAVTLDFDTLPALSTPHTSSSSHGASLRMHDRVDTSTAPISEAPPEPRLALIELSALPQAARGDGKQRLSLG